MNLLARIAAPFLLLAAPLLAACSDDDDPLPAYRQDLADALTDGAGRIRQLVLDSGDTLTVTNSEAVKAQKADTVYRIHALYIPSNGGAELTGMASVFASRPLALGATATGRDPLSLDALWRGGAYVNFHVSYKTSGNEHLAAFIEERITDEAAGYRLLRLRLYHDRNSDAENYTKQTYLCCRIDGYDGQLVHGRDSVAVVVPTKSGDTERRLPF